MEEGLMPSGVNRALSARLAKTDHTEKLVDQLRAAILTGDAAHARQIAECLANERITLKIELDKEEHQRRLEESYLNVKVHVEDRETSGCDIKMKFKPSDTIRDLKNSMKLQYEFPVEVQRWIIGKKIPKDNETLHKCGIRASGHTLYLYLTTARSVGLDQQQSMDTMPRGAVGGEGSGDYMTMGTLRESVRRPPELSHGLSRPPSRQMSTLSSSSGTTLSAVSENDQTSISPLRNSDFTPNLGQPQSRAKSQHRAQTNNPQEVQDNTVFATGQPIASSNLQGAAPVAQVSEETGEVGWVCPRCTFLNKPTRPGCEVCGGDRPPDYQAPIGYIMSKEELCWLADDEEQRQMLEEAERQNQQQLVERSKKNFSELLALDNRDLVPNTQAFDCPICFDNVPVGEGVVLRECLHTFCQDCLMNAVRTTEEASLKCPYQDDDYTCQAMLQDREVRALVSDDIYARYLQRSLDTAESQANNSYHCKTTDCHGWCIYEDLVNFFKCPVCNKENCLTCKAIHENMNCQQYQDDLKIRAANDHAAQQTQLMLNKLVSEGEAMPCPQCKVIVQKKDGCDWIKCSICKTEICWVTKGRRWGPNGEGDISGGCGCRVNGAKCDPRCNNCH